MSTSRVRGASRLLPPHMPAGTQARVRPPADRQQRLNLMTDARCAMPGRPGPLEQRRSRDGSRLRLGLVKILLPGWGLPVKWCDGVECGQPYGR
jgi:hypothetical protein